jgi:hypothetical protein
VLRNARIALATAIGLLSLEAHRYEACDRIVCRSVITKDDYLKARAPLLVYLAHDREVYQLDLLCDCSWWSVHVLVSIICSMILFLPSMTSPEALEAPQ